MISKIRVFLDTSALFAGIWSSTGGSRLIFKLGEAGAIQILVSSQVLSELEAALHEKAASSLGYLAILLEESQIEVVPSPHDELLKRCEQLIQHFGDAKVMAAAWNSQCDYFVTLDRRHFLENKRLGEDVPFRIGTPGDFLEWFRQKIDN